MSVSKLKICIYGACVAFLIGSTYKNLRKNNPEISLKIVLKPKNILYGLLGTIAPILNGIQNVGFISFVIDAPYYFPNFFVYQTLFPYYISKLAFKNPSNIKDALISKAILYRLGLVLLFTLHHSIQARPQVKLFLIKNKIIPERLERTLYVYISILCQYLLIKYWSINDKLSGAIVWKIPKWSEQSFWIRNIPAFIGMILISIASATTMDEEQFMGVKQACNINYKYKINDNNLDDKTQKQLCVNSFYKIVRHPQMLFGAVIFWFTPIMSLSRLQFAILFSIYVKIALKYEEQTLIKEFGSQYIEYQSQVPQLIPTWPLIKNVKITTTNKNQHQNP